MYVGYEFDHPAIVRKSLCWCLPSVTIPNWSFQGAKVAIHNPDTPYRYMVWYICLQDYFMYQANTKPSNGKLLVLGQRIGGYYQPVKQWWRQHLWLRRPKCTNTMPNNLQVSSNAAECNVMFMKSCRQDMCVYTTCIFVYIYIDRIDYTCLFICLLTLILIPIYTCVYIFIYILLYTFVLHIQICWAPRYDGLFVDPFLTYATWFVTPLQLHRTNSLL